MIHDFKLLVSKSSSLYYDFWTLIINKMNIANNLEDLSNIPINNDMPADLHKAIQESHQKSNYHNREL